MFIGNGIGWPISYPRMRRSGIWTWAYGGSLLTLMRVPTAITIGLFMKQLWISFWILAQLVTGQFWRRFPLFSTDLFQYGTCFFAYKWQHLFFFGEVIKLIAFVFYQLLWFLLLRHTFLMWSAVWDSFGTDAFLCSGTAVWDSLFIWNSQYVTM